MNNFLYTTTPDQVVKSFELMPIFEFAALFFVVIIAYLAVHNLFSKWHQLVKFSLAVFLGSLGYSFGKVVLLAVIVQPLLNVRF